MKTSTECNKREKEKTKEKRLLKTPSLVDYALYAGKGGNLLNVSLTCVINNNPQTLVSLFIFTLVDAQIAIKYQTRHC